MKTGVTIVLLIFLLSWLAPMFTQPEQLHFNLSQKLQGPSLQHFLGTDEFGSDVLAQLIYGGRVSLAIAFGVVGISTVIGLIAGTIAGYFGGVFEIFFTVTVDMLQAFPGFLLALAIIAFVGPGLRNIIFALCITSWTAYGRLVRGEVMGLKSKDYVVAARASGGNTFSIIIKHIWPNLVAVLAIQMSFGLAGAVISEAGLSFLGLGVPPGTPSWGSLISSGRKYLITDPALSIFPGIAILTLVFSFNKIGDGLRHTFKAR
jgi:peptide/nickel transport system permease protein